MKKYAIATIVAITGIAVYLTFSISGRLKTVDEQVKKEQTLPNLCFNSLGGESVCLQKLLDKPLLIMYFGVGCSHCEREAVLVKANNEKLLQACNVVMLSSDPLPEVETFSSKFGLTELKKLIIVADTAELFRNNFKQLGIPDNLLYGRDGVLAKRYSAETPTETLLEWINGLW